MLITVYFKWKQAVRFPDNQFDSKLGYHKSAAFRDQRSRAVASENRKDATQCQTCLNIANL